MTITVIDDIELPRHGKTRYPRLEVGQGFVLESANNTTRNNVSASYRFRNQKVKTRLIDGKLHVKRVS